MKLIAALTVPVLALGASILSAAPASAHTPAISAGCAGVHLSATSYDATLPNRWSVTIGGTTQSGTFGDSFDQTFPVPQDGSTVPWSAFIEASDGTYHGQDAGTVGPCGAPVDACADLPGAQPAGTPCTPPPDVQRVAHQTLESCDVTFGNIAYGAGVLTYDEEFTDTYVFNEQTNTFDLVTDTTATIEHVAFTAYTGKELVELGCTDKAVQPPALVSVVKHSHLDCADDVRITTTITTVTEFVYDAATNTWVPGTPVKHVTKDEQPVKPGVCGTTTDDQGENGDDDDDSDVRGHVTTGATVLPATTVAAASDTTQVPTAVDAGMSRSLDAASPVSEGDRSPGLLLLLGAAALVSLAGLRLRRS
jgi:hypothetical protein